MGLTVVFFIMSLVLVPTASLSYGIHQSIRHPNFSYTSDFIPVYDYGRYGKHINPLYVATEVVHHADRTNTTESQIAINNADWLIDNAVSFGNYSLLVHNFSFSAYKVEPPYISAMAQARAVIAMSEIYDITNDTKYLDAADRFLNPLFIDIKNGGVTDKNNISGGWWYEEYVFKAEGNDSKIEPRVLNGMMAVLKDLHKYYQATGDQKTKFLFDKGVVALRNEIHRYDTTIPNILKHYETNNNSQAKQMLETKGMVTLKNNTDTYYVNATDIIGYSFYDALGRLAGENYHKYHVGLLSTVLNITDDETLREYRDKWSLYNGTYYKVKLP